MTMINRLTSLSAFACLAAMAIGCATSNDPIDAPPEIAATVDVDIDPNAIESPPWALPETGDLPPDPGPPAGVADVADEPVVPEVDVQEEGSVDTSAGTPIEATSLAKPKVARFQMLTQTYIEGNGQQRVSLKMDRYSGETWRLDPASFSWVRITEAADSAPLPAGEQPRYAMQAQKSEPSAASADSVMRMDLTTGDAWLYAQQQSAWKSLAQ